MHGSALGDALLAPNATGYFNTVLQKSRNSQYQKTLRSDGGDSAFVPTTSIFVGTDFIVIPQTGKNASAYLNDGNGVDVGNYDLIHVCSGKPGGSYYTHMGALFHPLTFELLVDAVKNGGAADLSRIDLEKTCSKIIADGLTPEDGISTEIMAVGCLVQIFADDKTSKAEPEIKDYAKK